MSEIKATIEVNIDCAGMEEEAFRENMKEAIAQYIVERALPEGPIMQTDDGLEFYITDTAFGWNEDA